jgi:hypothetical protein
MMTDGWFLSRSAMLLTRASVASAKSGLAARVRDGSKPMPCDSTFASSMTYSPSSSHSAYQASSFG